ncbi:MAG: type II secretion system protein GspH [Rhizobiales bacterium]|nr:type II secretion system protein GspH [Hyphomicrobiales bacterium]
METKVEPGAPPTSGAALADAAVVARSGEDGIILLDLVLAVAVFAFVVLVALPSLPQGTTPARHAAYVLEVAAVLKTDRTAAARTGREIATRIDVPERRVAGGTNRQIVMLPEDLTLEVIASDICTTEPGRFAIAFAADGRSCGAVIRIGKGTRDWRIRINWLTGFVDVVAPQAG